MTTLALPAPVLTKGRFASLDAYTDEGLFEATGIRIAFTTRHGGVSEGAYASLNLGSHVDDELDRVLENRRIVQRAFGCADDPLIVPKQVHGRLVLTVRDAAEAADVQRAADEGADGVVVSTNRVAALLCFADCVPVIIASPSGRFAVVHAGWRGVENEISVAAVQELARLDAEALGCTPAEAAASLNVYIGPHIHAECFETGPEVRQQFARFGQECLVDPSNVDLARALRSQLTAVGVDEGRIADIDVCTVCSNDEFFSYRGQDGIAGRHGAFAVRL